MKPATEFERQRAAMVADQIAGRGITDARVLAAMGMVPRELFVPPAERAYAYADSALPIEAGQTISQPYMVATMLAALEISGDERVLEIGTGSGYAAAVLAQLAAEVFTIERQETLVELAMERLRRLGCHNVRCRCGDGSVGWPEQAPFDGIVVTAGAPVVPESLRQQLVVGGRLVIPIGPYEHQRLVRVVRRGEQDFATEGICAVRFVPLVGAEGWRDEAMDRG